MLKYLKIPVIYFLFSVISSFSKLPGGISQRVESIIHCSVSARERDLGEEKREEVQIYPEIKRSLFSFEL